VNLELHKLQQYTITQICIKMAKQTSVKLLTRGYHDQQKWFSFYLPYHILWHPITRTGINKTTVNKEGS